MLTRIQDKSELRALSELEQALFKNHCYSLEQLEDMYADQNYVFYTFKENDIVLGYMIVLETADEVELIKIGVSPLAQGKGIGTKLMSIIKEGPKDIFLEVSANNTNAISFYEYHGFQFIHRRKAYYQDGSDGLIYKYSVKEMVK
ncbi:GNAT family N-acetyltransferase [Ureaplasma ceti]|uniref:GNAT family N-acetyltransferase n=1 Tax=Ureaplasma ceti TaxID=3119530 RepID=A0ABP9U8C8_9BACT